MSRTPAQASLTVVRGATWEDEITYRDEAGQAIDLTGYEARMQVRTLAGQYGQSVGGLALGGDEVGDRRLGGLHALRRGGRGLRVERLERLEGFEPGLGVALRQDAEQAIDIDMVPGEDDALLG